MNDIKEFLGRMLIIRTILETSNKAYCKYKSQAKRLHNERITSEFHHIHGKVKGITRKFKTYLNSKCTTKCHMEHVSNCFVKMGKQFLQESNHTTQMENWSSAEWYNYYSVLFRLLRSQLIILVKWFSSLKL